MNGCHLLTSSDASECSTLAREIEVEADNVTSGLLHEDDIVCEDERSIGGLRVRSRANYADETVMCDMLVAFLLELQSRALGSIQSSLDVGVSTKKGTRQAASVLVRPSEPRSSFQVCIIIGKQKCRYRRGMNVCTLILNPIGSHRDFVDAIMVAAKKFSVPCQLQVEDEVYQEMCCPNGFWAHRSQRALDPGFLFGK